MADQNQLIRVGITIGGLNAYRQLLGDLKVRGHSALNVAAQRAVSRTIAPTGVARIARTIGENVNLPIRDIKKLIQIKKGSFEKPEGSMTLGRKATWLSQFLNGKQRSRGRTRGMLILSARKRASGKYGTKEAIQRAFIGNQGMKANITGVFQRVGKARLPLKRLRGPTALGILMYAQGNEGLKEIDDVMIDLGDVLEKNMLSAVDYILSQQQKGAPNGGS